MLETPDEKVNNHPLNIHPFQDRFDSAAVIGQNH